MHEIVMLVAINHSYRNVYHNMLLTNYLHYVNGVWHFNYVASYHPVKNMYVDQINDLE